MSVRIKIGLLKVGSAPAGLVAARGDYDMAFRALLAEEEFEFVTYDIEHDLFPESVTVADAWIITGSRHGVYEQHSWLAPLEQLIRDIQAARRPLVGICFGHQIVAQALGGRVERAACGWIAGPQRYRDEHGEIFYANAWHRDQVVEAPPGAEIIASGEECPVAGLKYDGPIMTLQPHPEFDETYFQGLLKERGAALPEALRAQVATVSETQTLNHDYVRSKIKCVLKSN